jgi:tRNA threonylcarbamoyladenosine biosynthesis protein TsaE
MKWTVNNLSDTEAAAAALCKVVESPAVILMHGDLAAGKTTFVQSFVRQRHAYDEAVHSPTFTIENTYHSQTGAPSIYHLDLYRLKYWEEFVQLGLLDRLPEKFLLFIEWAERFETELFLNYFSLRKTPLWKFQAVVDGESRSFSVGRLP